MAMICRTLPCKYRKGPKDCPVFRQAFFAATIAILFVLGSPTASAAGLNLSDCLLRAAEHNASVLSARERIQEAEARVRSSQADRIPDLDIQDQHRRTTRKYPSFFSVPKYSHQVVSTLKQRVFSGGQIAAGVRLSREIVSEGKAAYRLTLESVLERVANSFLDTLEQAETQRTLTESIATQKRRLEEINAKIEAGVMLETNRLQAELLILEDERAMLVSRTREQLARDTIRVLLMLPKGQPVLLDSDLGEFAKLKVDALLQDLSLDKSPPLLRLQARVRQAKAQVRLARAGFQPKVDLNITQYHIANGLSFASKDANYSEAMGVIQLPVFDGGKRRADLKKAKRGLEASRHEEAAQHDELTIQVGQAVLGVKEARARLRASKGRIELAVRNRQIVQDRYLEGAAIQSEILDADVEWHRAKLEEISSRFSILRNTVLLLRLTGRLSRLSLLGAAALSPGTPSKGNTYETSARAASNAPPSR
jgi:outer membrane protein TolC